MSKRRTRTVARPPKTRYFVVAAIAGAIAVPIVAAAPAEAKDRVVCTGFDFHCDKTGYGAVAEHSFWTMAGGHNCTNYVAYRLIRDGMPRRLQDMHNGTDWAHDARAHHYLVDKVPTAGSVAQWMSGSPNVSWAGHVAYVEAVGPDSITVTEDNYSSGPLRVRIITRNDPAWPSHFIHFGTPTGSAAPISSPVPGFPAFDWMNAWFPQLAKAPSAAPLAG